MKRIFAILLAVCFVIPLGIGMNPVAVVASVGTELITNGGFESTGSWSNSSVGTWDESASHTGSYSFKMTTKTYIYQTVDVIPDTEYTFSYWAKPDLSNNYTAMGYKFEFSGVSGEDIYGRFDVPAENSNVWKQYSTDFVVPKGCTRMNVLVRMYAAATIYFDDVSLVQKSETKRHIIEYADAINYIEDGEGLVKVRLNQTSGNTPSSSAYLTVSITNDTTGSTVYQSENVAISGEIVSHTFSTTGMAYVDGEERPHTLTVTLHDGESIYTESRKIYVYPRPTMLDADGQTYYGTGDARTPFDPVIAYHVDMYNRSYPQYSATSQSDIDKVGQVGINVVQSLYETWSGIKSNLQMAQQNNQKVLVRLYPGMVSAGHTSNLANTETIVKGIVDEGLSDAVFGYILLDEPYAYVQDPGEEFLRAYNLIRKYDKEHIITFVNDKSGRDADAAQFCDVLMIDPYILNTHSAGSYVAERTENAVATGKPVYTIVQVYPLNGKVPTANEIRSMTMQALFSGAKGVGYFPIYNYKTETVDGTPYRRSLHEISEIWTPMQERKDEIPLVADIFTRADKTYDSTVTDTVDDETGVRTITWYDGEDQYIAFLNTKGRGLNSGETSAQFNAAAESLSAVAEISLPGVSSVNTILGNVSRVSVANNVLTVNMEYGGVYVCCISGGNAVSGLNGTFQDGDLDGMADGWGVERKADAVPYEGYSGSYISTSSQTPVFNMTAPYMMPEVGETYRISGYTKGTQPTLTFAGYTQTNTKVWERTATVPSATDGWTPFDIEIALPENTTASYFVVGLSGNGTAEASFADLAITKIISVFNGKFLDMNADGTADNWGLSVLNDSKPYASYVGNYVTKNSTSPTYNAAAKFPMPEEGATYTISGYVKGSAPRLYITFYTASGAYAGEWKKVLYPSGWTYFSETVQVSSATSAASYFILGLCGNNSSEASYADLKVEKSEPAIIGFNGTFLDRNQDGDADSWDIPAQNDVLPYGGYTGNYVTLTAQTPVYNTNETFTMPEEDETYWISGYVKGAAPVIRVLGSTATDAQAFSWEKTLTEGTTAWSAFTFQAEIPKDTAASDFVIGLCSGDGSAASFADLSVRKMDTFNGKFQDFNADGKAENWGLSVNSDSKPYESYTGKYVTKYSTSPTYNSAAKFPMPTEEEEYYVTGYVKGSAPRLYFTFQNENGAYAGEWKQVMYPSGWTPFTYKINVANATSAATQFVLGICGNNTNEASFADIRIYKVKRNILSSVTTWGNPDGVPAAAITTVAGSEEGRSAVKVDMHQATKGYARVAAIWPSASFEAATTYKVTLTYKTDDITQRPLLRFANLHTSSNIDKNAAAATAADTWTTTSFYMVTPDTVSGLKIELKLGAAYGESYTGATYMTISDIFVEKVENTVMFPDAISSGESVSVSYLLAEGTGGVAAPVNRKVSVGLYKKEATEDVLCAENVVETPEWIGTATWRLPAELNIPLTVPQLTSGTYELKVQTLDIETMQPITTYSKTYTISE